MSISLVGLLYCILHVMYILYYILPFLFPPFSLLPLPLPPPQVPEIFRSLQVSVQAVLVGSPYDTDWFEQGVASKSLVDKWPLPLAKPSHSPSPLIGSITSDARHLYVHGQFGLMKVGSGYGNTIKVCTCTCTTCTCKEREEREPQAYSH